MPQSLEREHPGQTHTRVTSGRGRDATQSSSPADAAVRPRRNLFPSGDQARFCASAWPSSLETVSAAASDSAAEVASRKTAFPVSAESAAQAAVTARLASTCDAVRASRLFGGPQLLLAAVAQAGSDPGQDEDRNQSHEGSRPRARVEQKADHGPGDGPGKAHSPHKSGQSSECRRSRRRQSRADVPNCSSAKICDGSGQVSH